MAESSFGLLCSHTNQHLPIPVQISTSSQTKLALGSPILERLSSQLGEAKGILPEDKFCHPVAAEEGQQGSAEDTGVHGQQEQGAACSLCVCLPCVGNTMGLQTLLMPEQEGLMQPRGSSPNIDKIGPRSSNLN